LFNQPINQPRDHITLGLSLTGLL